MNTRLAVVALATVVIAGCAEGGGVGARKAGVGTAPTLPTARRTHLAPPDSDAG